MILIQLLKHLQLLIVLYQLTDIITGPHCPYKDMKIFPLLAIGVSTETQKEDLWM